SGIRGSGSIVSTGHRAGDATVCLDRRIVPERAAVPAPLRNEVSPLILTASLPQPAILAPPTRGAGILWSTISYALPRCSKVQRLLPFAPDSLIHKSRSWEIHPRSDIQLRQYPCRAAKPAIHENCYS